MSVSRIFDLLSHIEQNHSQPTALAAKEKGQWRSYSTKDFVQTAYDFAYGLINLGVNKGDTIGLIANNRPEWNFADFGMQLSGAISVPIYPTISEHDLEFVLNDAEVKYVFVSDESLYQKVKKLEGKIKNLQGVYTFDEVDGAPNWSEILKKGKEKPAKEKVDEIKKGIQESDLATILYTSGTTGNPKGVMLCHRNLVSNFMACTSLPPVNNTCSALSFLPLNHVYERMLTYVWMYLGVSIYYAENMESIGDNLKEIKPHIFSTVPRLLEKVYDKIVAKGNELKGIKRSLFFWALNLGLRYEPYGANGSWYEFQLKLANKLIFSKWREALGGNVRAVVSGGAALQPRLARVFWAGQIPILEGYGLTETSPVVAVNNFDPNGLKFGTVGPLIDKVEVKIAEDGEILVKGPNVMLGYYKRPDLTEEVLEKEGWFHTGDIGILEEGRFLKITDRKKEMFKTSGGKYIAPQVIENKLKESVYIEQVMVIGENKKFAAALIVPAFDFLKEWCKQNKLACATNEEMIAHKEVMNLIYADIEKVNKGLAQYETIKKVRLMANEWSIEKGEMTPTLKLKRKKILENNADLAESIYH